MPGCKSVLGYVDKAARKAFAFSKPKATGNPAAISAHSICEGWINRCSHTERTGRSLVLKPQGYSEASIAFAKLSAPEHQPPELSQKVSSSLRLQQEWAGVRLSHFQQSPQGFPRQKVHRSHFENSGRGAGCSMDDSKAVWDHTGVFKDWRTVPSGRPGSSSWRPQLGVGWRGPGSIHGREWKRCL